MSDAGTKYKGWVSIQIEVEFEDNGVDSICDQAVKKFHEIMPLSLEYDKLKVVEVEEQSNE